MPPWTSANTVDLVFIMALWSLGAAATWRLIWPRWKVPGKGLATAAFTAALSLLIGHWSLLVMGLHQGLGLGVHVWFSRKHGFTWWAVEDPEEYVRLSKAWVGYGGEDGDRQT